jgi:hypothetical protein
MRLPITSFNAEVDLADSVIFGLLDLPTNIHKRGVELPGAKRRTKLIRLLCKRANARSRPAVLS